MEQGVLPVSVTSGKSPDLSGPQYSWEDYLMDLPLPSLRPVAFCLPRPFMGTALISSTALWHRVLHDAPRAPSCEEVLS